jgi:hypothetical protein
VLECRLPICQQGQCSFITDTEQTNLKPCADGAGTCWFSECCTGCIDTTISFDCRSGTSNSYCGVGGEFCTRCQGEEECISGKCQSSKD